MKWVIIAWLLFIAMILTCSDAKAHENDKYKHQTESITRYGQGDKDNGIQFWYVNEAQTVCVDAIFNHGMLHITKPYTCKGE